MQYLALMPYDVRAIANFVLDLADADGRGLSNMQVNKIVYFLHVDCLSTRGEGLLTAKIEAWEHGPVFRELYAQFKRFEDGPIRDRATAINARTGGREIVSAPLPPDLVSFLVPLARQYSSMSASALRFQSHEPGGPWDTVWNHDTTTQATMRITDESILDWFRRSAKH